MKLLSTRDLNAGDPLPPLGQRKPRPDEVPQAAPPAPTPNPDVWRDSNGRLFTDIKENEKARLSVDTQTGRFSGKDFGRNSCCEVVKVLVGLFKGEKASEYQVIRTFPYNDFATTRLRHVPRP